MCAIFSNYLDWIGLLSIVCATTHNGDDLNKWINVHCYDGCISNCSDNDYELW